MRYNKIIEAKFLERINRFTAIVNMNGIKETVHVKNTGRCKELLIEGVTVYLSDEGNEKRKTRYDLIAVKKGNQIINMDSIAPNKAVKEFIENGSFLSHILNVKSEVTYKSSRFDLFVETNKEQYFIEVKGVTLEEDGIARFPDAPSERAIKHIEELIDAKRNGYQAILFFVIQMTNIKYFTPNTRTQPKFAEALIKAEKEGVTIVAYDSIIRENEIRINNPVKVQLQVDESLEKIVEPLLHWYDLGHRELPWRKNKDPYRIWISEIMLQQTRVEAVKGYYERFMKRLPSIVELANINEEELLKLWEGLGYYNRAKNLQKAAKILVEKNNGQMFRNYKEIIELPGIGSYTAGAISSIAFQEKRPAVDGNVLRVISRIKCSEEDILKTKVKTVLEEQLVQYMPNDRPGDFNQAMMELGATICVPNGRPYCEKCPLSFLCEAHEQGCELEYPKKSKKKDRKIEKRTILLIKDLDKILVRKRDKKGLLSGLYEFPNLDGWQSIEEVMIYLKELGVSPIHISKLSEEKHIFSHIEWRMIGYLVKVDELSQKKEELIKENFIFSQIEEVENKYPLPTAFANYAKYVKITQGNKKFIE
ncbi:MAG: A/G-specific adenine glycosylase [Lachnospiraceae bacterium]